MKVAALILLIGMGLAPAAEAITLDCGVEKTDVEGRIGVRISKSGYISKVHPGSPADVCGLKRSDHVTAVDGRKRNIDNISGEPGTLVDLEVKRGFRRFHVAVERQDVRQIYY
jgi:C-terminal processing protease CtpA/Prc